MVCRWDLLDRAFSRRVTNEEVIAEIKKKAVSIFLKAVSILFVCEIGKRRLHQLVEKEMVTFTIKQVICQDSHFQRTSSHQKSLSELTEHTL